MADGIRSGNVKDADRNGSAASMTRQQPGKAEEAVLYDADGIRTEGFSRFSEAPLEFEEMSAGLRKDLLEVYEMTGMLNRFSRDYPKCCRLMETLIRRVGSCCVTKAALEHEGVELPGLKDLNLKELYCMVSFNFRKTRAAFHEGNQKGCLDVDMLEQECRLTDLAEQLKATEDKIRQIESGRIDIRSIIDRVKTYKGQKGIIRAKQEPRPFLPGKARSLPVFTSVIRKILEERKKNQKEANKLRRMLGIDRPPFKPASLKDCLIREEKDSGKPSEPARPAPSAEKKDDAYIKSAVSAMQKSAEKKQAPSDPKLDKEFDESMRRIFGAYQNYMDRGWKAAPKPGRA